MRQDQETTLPTGFRLPSEGLPGEQAGGLVGLSAGPVLVIL